MTKRVKNLPERDSDSWPRLRLYTLLTGLLALLLFIGFFTAWLVNDYRVFRYREADDRLAVVSAAASRTRDLFSDILITMKLLDEWIQSHPDRDPRFDPDFNRLVEVFRAHTDNRIDIRMVDDHGGLFYFPAAGDEPLADVSDRDYFRSSRFLTYETLYFAEPVKSRVTGKWGIPVAYRLKQNPHGMFILFAAVEFEVFDRMFADLVEGSDRAVDILRSDLLVLERTPFDERIVGKPLPLPRIDRTWDTFHLSGEKSLRRFIVWQRIPDMPLIVVLGDSYDRMMADWFRFALIRALAALAVLLLLVLLGVRILRLQKRLVDYRNRLERAARTDSLTGLMNRTAFFERLDEELARANRYRLPLVMLVADIDRFKTVNDTWGHPVGDRILKEVADAFSASVRAPDLVGRIGGEEFGFLLTDANLDRGREIAERIRVRAGTVTYKDWPGGVSIGVADWRGDGETADQLYKRADDALLEAKRSGRNRVVCADG